MLPRNAIFVSGSLVALCAAALTVWTLVDQSKVALLRPNDAGLVDRGKQVYQANCASCHGDNLQGQPDWQSPGPDGRLPAPPHDQSGHTWHHADGLLFELTKHGLKKFAGEDYESNMPVYADILSDQDIIAVLSFIKSTWPPEIRARHDLLNTSADRGGVN